MVAEELVYGESEGGSDDRALLGRIWGLSGFDVDTAQREQRRARREVEQGLSRRRPELEQRAERLLAQAPRLFRRPQTPPEGEAFENGLIKNGSVHRAPDQTKPDQSKPDQTKSDQSKPIENRQQP